MDLSSRNLITISEDLFESCESLKKLYLQKNQISEIRNGAFDNLKKLTEINLSYNKMTTTSESLFEPCALLEKMSLVGNQIREINKDAFKNLKNLTSIYLHNNKLTTISECLFDSCESLEKLSLGGNRISEIRNGAFKNLKNLTSIYLHNNKLTTISECLFESCESLEKLSLGGNQIGEIRNGAFKNLKKLTWINLKNNKLTKISKDLFQSCESLEKLGLGGNQISEIRNGAFDNLKKLTEISLMNNKLTTISEGLFGSCESLVELDLCSNKIKELPINSFNACDKVRSLNLENNSISSISFSTLEPLKNCRNINIQNNVLLNIRNLYSYFFKKYTSYEAEDIFKNENTPLGFMHDESCFYYLMRRQDYDDEKKFEKSFLSFFLSTSSKDWCAIFVDDNNKKSLKSRFDIFNIYNSKLSLLDFFISVFGEIDDSKIIHLKDHIDQLTRRDSQLINKDFVIRSEHSIEYLCTRNIYAHFKSFFPHFYFDLLSLVSKTHIKAKDFKPNEEDYFEGIRKYILKIDRSIFIRIDYEKCFNIALANRNSDIAVVVILLLRYYFLKWPESTEMKDTLNKFNRNLLLSFESIFEHELDKIVVILLDIRKLDQLKRRNRERKKDNRRFLEYDIGQFNAKLPAVSEYRIKESERITKKGKPKKLEFLELIQKNNELLRHESNQLILEEKWREKAVFIYYFQFFWSLLFVISYTIYIEYRGRTDVHIGIQQAAKYISLAFVIINLISEFMQLVSSISSRQKLSDYAGRYTNRTEWINFILCIPAIVLDYGDLKSSLCSLTICLSYVVLMTRMDKMRSGGYVKVIGKIFVGSLEPLVVVVVLLLGFLMAFRNRAQYKGSVDKAYSFDKVGFFNTSFEYSLPLIYTMMAGNHQLEDMGINNFTWPNLINFIICFCFLFVISTLALNIFTGIAIDEIRNLIADSNIRITKDKISYVYERSSFDGRSNKVNKLIKKFSDFVFSQMRKVFLINDLIGDATEFCLSKINGKINQENVVKAEKENFDNQDHNEAYEDDKYSEHFDTLEETISKQMIELKESMAKQANEQKESMSKQMDELRDLIAKQINEQMKS